MSNTELKLEDLKNGILGTTYQGDVLYRHMEDGIFISGSNMTIPMSQNLKDCFEEGTLGINSTLKEKDVDGKMTEYNIYNFDDEITVKWDFKIADREEFLNKQIKELGKDNISKEINRLEKKLKDKQDEYYKLVAIRNKNDSQVVKMNSTKADIEKTAKTLDSKKRLVVKQADNLEKYKEELDRIKVMTPEDKQAYLDSFTSASREEIREYLEKNGVTITKEVYDTKLQKQIDKIYDNASKEMKGKSSKEVKKIIENRDNEVLSILNDDKYKDQIHTVEYHYKSTSPSPSKQRQNRTPFKKEYVKIDGKELKGEKTINNVVYNGKTIVNNPKLNDQFGVLPEAEKCAKEFEEELKLQGKDRKYVDIIYNKYEKAESLEGFSKADKILIEKYDKALFPLVDYDASASLAESAVADNLFTESLKSDEILILKDIEFEVKADAYVLTMNDEDSLRKIAKETNTYKELERLSKVDKLSKEDMEMITGKKLKAPKKDGTLSEKSAIWNKQLEENAYKQLEDMHNTYKNFDDMTIDDLKSINKEIKQAIADKTTLINLERNKYITNVLFDGMDLMDTSIAPTGHNFVFCRHNNIKAGCTVMDLQQFFIDKCKEYNIDLDTKKVTNMFGVEQDLKKIKMVMTESSFKQLKLKNTQKYRFSDDEKHTQLYKDWCKMFDESDGKLAVCGIEHANELGVAKNNYQVMASLDLHKKLEGVNYDDCKSVKDIANKNMDLLMKEQMDSINKMKKDDIEFMKYVKTNMSDDTTAQRYLSLISEQNKDVFKTKEFKSWKSAILSKSQQELGKGRLVTAGRNQVLIGDIEALANMAIHGEKEVERSLKAGEDKYSMFKNNMDGKGRERVFTSHKCEKVGLARNPQIGDFSTVSAINCYNDKAEICKYVNFGEDMLVTDLREYAFQVITSGSDLDYDHVLTMQNEILDKLINAAWKDKDVIISVDETPKSKAKYIYSAEDRVRKGEKIGKNMVGQNSNLAQMLQAQRQHLIYNGGSKEQIEETTKLIHKLNMLQNHEIDGAKSPSAINSAEEMGSILRNKNVLKYSEEEAKEMNKILAKEKAISDLKEAKKNVKEKAEIQDLNKKFNDLIDDIENETVKISKVTINTPKRPNAFLNIKKGKTVTTHLDCNLDMLIDRINENKINANTEKGLKDLYSFVQKPTTTINSATHKRIKKFVESVSSADSKINSLYAEAKKYNYTKEEIKEIQEVADKYAKFAEDRFKQIWKNLIENDDVEALQQEYIHIIRRATSYNVSIQKSLLNALYTNNKELFLNSFVEGEKLPLPTVLKKVAEDEIDTAFVYGKKVFMDVNEKIDQFCANIDKQVNSLFYNNTKNMSEDEMKEYLKGKLSKDEIQELRVKWNMSSVLVAKMSRIEAINKDIAITTNVLKDVETKLITNLMKYEINRGYAKTIENLEKHSNKKFNISKELDDKTIDKIFKTRFAEKDGIGNVVERINKDADKVRDFATKDLERKLIEKGEWNMKQELQFVFYNKKNASKRLIQTELTNYYNKGVLESYKTLGLTQYVFVSEHDSKVCSICRERDGKIYANDNAEVGINQAPLHTYCRCTQFPVLDLDFLGK